MKLRQLKEISLLNKSNHTFIDYQIEVVSIYLDVDPEDLLDEPTSYLTGEFNKVINILNSSPKSKDIIEVNNIQLKKIPFTKLSVGAWIDIDYYINKEDNLLNILPILYRKFECDEFGDITYENYSYDIGARQEHFLDLDIDLVIGVKDEFIQFRDNIIKNYSGLFEQPFEEDEEEIGNTISEKQRKQLDKERSGFVWEKTLLDLADNDVTKIDSILEMSIILFFNLLSTRRLYN